MSPRGEIEFAGEQLTKSFGDSAKLEPEDRRRILAASIKSEQGLRDLERLTRAGNRYEAIRYNAEITAPREQLLKEVGQTRPQHRMPPPTFAPGGSQREATQPVSATDIKVERIRQILETQSAGSDIAKTALIHRDRCSLENIRLERLVEAEHLRQAAERDKQKNRSTRQTSRPSASRPSASFRKNARDTGLGD